MLEVRPAPKLDYNLSDFIFTKISFLDSDICNNLIEENKEFVKEGKAKNWSSAFHKHLLDTNHIIHRHLESVIQEAENYYNIKIEFVEQYHVKKYTFGNFYGEHIDHFATRVDRKLSIIVQLSDSTDYGAGDLNIAGCKMPREKGTVIIFPSHFKHSVDKIGFGERWVLISWAWGPAYTRG